MEMAVSRFYEKYPEYRNGTKEQYESGELSAATVLAELGGFDLAGMTGLFLGGAAAKIPVLTDGFLSTVSGFWRFSSGKRRRTICSRPISPQNLPGRRSFRCWIFRHLFTWECISAREAGRLHDPASQDGCKGI